MIKNTKRVPQWTTPHTLPTAIGTHLIADFWGGKVFDTHKEVEKILRAAAKAANSPALKVATYKFEPQGITGVVLLAESHISIHTWPEIAYVGVDIFTCGAKARPKDCLAYLQGIFQPEQVRVTEVDRGVR